MRKARQIGVRIFRGEESLRAYMRSGANPWFIVSGLLFGIPWLVLLFTGVVIGLERLPEDRAPMFLVLAALLTVTLTGLIDLIAVATIWLALYALSGRETLEVTRKEARVRRAVGPLARTIRIHRGSDERVALLDVSRAPGRVPRARLEITFERTKIRLGAGLAADEAEELAAALTAFLRDNPHESEALGRVSAREAPGNPSSGADTAR